MPSLNDTPTIATKNIIPSSGGLFVVTPTTPGLFRFALGHSDVAFAQKGGNLVTGSEPVPSRKEQTGANVTGDLTQAVVEYFGSGLESATNYVKLVRLPVNAMIIPELCSVVNATDQEAGITGADLTISIGDDVDPTDADAFTKICSALPVAQGEVKTFSESQPKFLYDPTRYEEETWIVASFSGAIPAGTKVVIKIAYNLNN